MFSSGSAAIPSPVESRLRRAARREPNEKPLEIDQPRSIYPKLKDMEQGRWVLILETEIGADFRPQLPNAVGSGSRMERGALSEVACVLCDGGPAVDRLEIASESSVDEHSSAGASDDVPPVPSEVIPLLPVPLEMFAVSRIEAGGRIYIIGIKKARRSFPAGHGRGGGRGQESEHSYGEMAFHFPAPKPQALIPQFRSRSDFECYY